MLQKDLREFIELLNSHQVEYVIVGGHAVAYHGYPRFTGDIDFFIRPSPENAERVFATLREFGFDSLDAYRDMLSSPGRILQLGHPPNRIDLLTKISGVEFGEVWDTSAQAQLDGLPVRFIGFEALLTNKRAAGRPKDLVDADTITRVHRSE